MVNQAGTPADENNNIFARKPDVSAPLQPVTQGDGTGLRALSPTVFIKAQAAAEFYQTAEKSSGRPEQ